MTMAYTPEPSQWLASVAIYLTIGVAVMAFIWVSFDEESKDHIKREFAKSSKMVAFIGLSFLLVIWPALVFNVIYGMFKK